MSRHIIIGDIHGCYKELLELLAHVGATDEDILVSVGDLVDRGPDSPAVLNFFRERCARGRAVVPPACSSVRSTPRRSPGWRACPIPMRQQSASSCTQRCSLTSR